METALYTITPPLPCISSVSSAAKPAAPFISSYGVRYDRDSSIKKIVGCIRLVPVIDKAEKVTVVGQALPNFPLGGGVSFGATEKRNTVVTKVELFLEDVGSSIPMHPCPSNQPNHGRHTWMGCSWSKVWDLCQEQCC